MLKNLIYCFWFCNKASCSSWHALFKLNISDKLFHDGDRYHIETNGRNQWSKSMDCFLYDNVSVMKELNTYPISFFWIAGLKKGIIFMLQYFFSQEKSLSKTYVMCSHSNMVMDHQQTLCKYIYHKDHGKPGHCSCCYLPRIEM